MKQNNIETAREFVKIPIGIGNIPQWSESLFEYVANKMVAYHSYLTAQDSEGAKSAEERIIAAIDSCTYCQEKWVLLQIDDVKQILAAQFRKELSRSQVETFLSKFKLSEADWMTIADWFCSVAIRDVPELSDEEIEEMAKEYDPTSLAVQLTFIDGAKWARSKMQNKTA